MILVTRINGVEQFYVNDDKIEFIEATPDTVISLDTGRKIVVAESVDQILHEIAVYKTKLFQFRSQGYTD
jgi:flagellar protein FlbD